VAEPIIAALGFQPQKNKGQFLIYATWNRDVHSLLFHLKIALFVLFAHLALQLWIQADMVF